MILHTGRTYDLCFLWVPEPCDGSGVSQGQRGGLTWLARLQIIVASQSRLETGENSNLWSPCLELYSRVTEQSCTVVPGP